jgi:serine/threonine protein phosphatase PrpC
MSEDHKPNLLGERVHIKSTGLTVQTNVVQPSPDGGDPRENSGGGSNVAATANVHRIRKWDSNLLGMSCAFGDFDYNSNAGLPPSRQMVVCTPNVPIRERAYNEDLYLILACNRVWDVMSNKDVGRIVTRRIEELRQDSIDDDNNDNKFLWGEVLARVGDKLLTMCLDAGSRDNISVLIVAFPALGMAFAPLWTTSLSELVASKKEVVNIIAMVDGVTRALAYE